MRVETRAADVTVGSGVTVAGSGVVVTGTYTIHGVCVAERVAPGVGPEVEGLQPTIAIASMVPITTSAQLPIPREPAVGAYHPHCFALIIGI